MSEGIHATPPAGMQSRRNAGKKQKWALVFAGTASALLIAGILFQLFRPEAGQAQERTNAPGKASVNAAAPTATEQALARIVSGNDRAMVTWKEVADECMLRYAKEVLENIINRKIIEQACASKNIQISDAEVDQEIVKIAGKFSMTVDQWYQMLQAERNVSPPQYRRDIIWPMLALRRLAGDDIKVTNREIDEAIQHNYGERVKVRVIVCDNIRRANEAWEKVSKQPEEFERVVREYSIDPSSRALGGSVPPIARYSGDPSSRNLEEEAFKLKTGEISNLVEINKSQYIIMRCEGRTEPVQVEKKDVQRQIYETIVEAKIQKAAAATFQQLKDNARVDNFLTNETSQKAGIKQVGAAVPAARGPNPAAGDSITPAAAQQRSARSAAVTTKP